MKYCPKCMTDQFEGDKFCRTCASPLVDRMGFAQTQAASGSGAMCPGCGGPVQASWKVCSRCGLKLQAAQPTAAHAYDSFSSICRVCGKANRAGTRFCEGCGNIIEVDAPQGGQQAWQSYDTETTHKSVFDSPGGAGAGRGSYGAGGMGQAAGFAPAPAACGRCGAVLRPGLNFCEMCGAPAGYVEAQRQPRSYKWLVITGIVILVLGAAAAGYHFWGVKITVAVSADPAGDAEIYLDGERLGRTENGRITINHVLRGAHALIVKRSGFDDYPATLDLGLTDFSKSVAVNLKRTVFTLTVKGTPNDSKVKLQLQDNEDTASAPKDVGQWDYAESGYVIPDVLKGKPYTLIIKRPGYRDFKQEVSLDSNKTVTATWIISMAGEWTGSYTDNSYTASGAETRFTLSITDTPTTGTSTTSSVSFSGTLADGATYTISEATVSQSSRYVMFKVVRGENTYNFSGSLDTDLMRLTNGTWYTTGPGYGYGSWSMTRSQTTIR